MAAKLVNSSTNDMPVSELEPGQLAVITAWPESRYVDLIVQRHKIKQTDRLIVIGRDSGGWNNPTRLSARHRVRPVESGSTLEV